ncbi:MAG: putative O-glycosylation ligase, exosortase A system-associated [Spiribacter salinus]|uniref:Putative O-glycosylation ligase, exosortase A system-associated n=1 Tax=Spiribacter salinus TaxID=1335746 RepID=A0A540VTN6_9GAMM|nr:MAG: putative O-glycosylation ligase, exosortase A system-associated [Spiribacter salinus]
MALRDLLVLGILFAGIAVALFRPWIGVLTWNWISFMNPHRLTWYFRDFPVAQGVAVTTLLGLLFTKERRPPPFRAETVLLCLLFLYFVMTTAAAWDVARSVVQLEKVFKIYLFVLVTMMLIYGYQKIRLLMLVTIASLGFFGFKGGLFAVLTGGNYRIWGPPGSFIADNTSLGLALCMLLPMALFAARAEPSRWVRSALLAVFWLSILAILFTYSRGALLGLIAALVALGWRYKAYGIVLAVVAGIVFVMMPDLLPEQWVARQETTLDYREDQSAMQRIQAWGVAVNVALERPFSGAGFAINYASPERWLAYANFLGDWENRPRVAHSIYFQILGQHGFVALGLFLGLIAVAFFRLGRLAKRCSGEATRWIGLYARGMQLSLIPYCVAGAFLDLAYFDLFYTVVLFSVVLEREYQDMRARDIADVTVEASAPPHQEQPS